MRVLLCDDDARLREVLAELLNELGHTVVAATDAADDGVDLLGRARPEVAIVDLALRRGSGVEVVRAAVAAGVKTVVFSSFVNDLPSVPSGAVAIAKPDFAGLESALHGLTARDEDGARGIERRRLRIVGRPSPSAPIEDANDFYRALGSAWDGDALLAVHVDDERTARKVAAVARAVVRDYDNVAQRANEVLVLLAACGPYVQAVEARIQQAWRTGPGLDVPLVTSATAIADGEAPSDALQRVRAEVRARGAATAARVASTAARLGLGAAAGGVTLDVERRSA